MASRVIEDIEERLLSNNCSVQGFSKISLKIFCVALSTIPYIYFFILTFLICSGLISAVEVIWVLVLLWCSTAVWTHCGCCVQLFTYVDCDFFFFFLTATISCCSSNAGHIHPLYTSGLRPLKLFQIWRFSYLLVLKAISCLRDPLC